MTKLKMMKQITKETARVSYHSIIKVEEGKLHNLLYEEQPTAQIVDGIGWVADVYEVDGVAVVTGYKPIGIRPADELIKKYEAAAKEIRDRWLPHVEMKSKLHALVVEFAHEAV